MRVLLARRFRGNRNASQLQEEEVIEDLQNEEEEQQQQQQQQETESPSTEKELAFPSAEENQQRPHQQQLLERPLSRPNTNSSDTKLEQNQLSRKRRAPKSLQKKENCVNNNSKRSCRQVLEEVLPHPDTKPRARETDCIDRVNKNSPSERFTSAATGSASNRTGETIKKSKVNSNCRKMVSGGPRRNHYCHNSNFRRQEDEEEHVLSWQFNLNRDHLIQNQLGSPSTASRRRLNENDNDNVLSYPSDPDSYEDQQHLENDPASARGDISSCSPERGSHFHNNNNNNKYKQSASSAKIVGDDTFVVLEREEPQLMGSTASMTPLPRNTSNTIYCDRGERDPAKCSVVGSRRENAHHLTADEIRFRDLLKKERGLEIKEQAGDGNCLFRAISLQVYGDPSMHAEVRKQCMDHMERDQEHFSQFVTGEPFKHYVTRTRQDGVHGNNPEIQASSELFNRPIEVFTPQNGSVPLNIFHAEYKTGDVPIRLSYHDGNHYNAVIDPLAPTAGLGLGLPGLQPPGYADKMQMAKAVAESIDTKDEMELRQVMETSRLEYKDQGGNKFSANNDDELQRAIKESRLSAEHINSNNALSWSDMDATYFELEQAALEHSLQSYSQKEEGQKRRASTSKTAIGGGSSEPKPTTKGDRKAPAVDAPPTSSSSAVSLPCPSQESIPVAATASSASSSAAVQKTGTSPPLQLLPVEDYPSSVQELVMNGFSLSAVVKAYHLVGNNFDDMLSLCLANSNVSST